MALETKKQLENKMQKTLENYKQNLQKIRTGRAHAGILDHVVVEYYGNMVPISQVATVIVADARTITVQPWEQHLTSTIEKAIRDSDLGLNPASSGNLIRVPMPPLTEERRKELIKVVKSEGEDTKVAVRNIRRDANNELKNQLKNKEISEDEVHRFEDEIQKITDKFIKEVDAATTHKENELLTV